MYDAGSLFYISVFLKIEIKVSKHLWEPINKTNLKFSRFCRLSGYFFCKWQNTKIHSKLFFRFLQLFASLEASSNFIMSPKMMKQTLRLARTAICLVILSTFTGSMKLPCLEAVLVSSSTLDTQVRTFRIKSDSMFLGWHVRKIIWWILMSKILFKKNKNQILTHLLIQCF